MSEGEAEEGEYTIDERVQSLEDSLAQETAAREKIQQWISQNLRNTLKNINDAVNEVTNNLQTHVDSLQQQLDDERAAREGLQEELQTLRASPLKSATVESKGDSDTVRSLLDRVQELEREKEDIKNQITKNSDLVGLALEELEEIRNSKPADSSSPSDNDQERLSRPAVEEIVKERLNTFKSELKTVIDKLKRGILDHVEDQIKRIPSSSSSTLAPSSSSTPVSVPQEVQKEKEPARALPQPANTATAPTSTSANLTSSSSANAGTMDDPAKRAEKQRQIRENAEKQEREKQQATQKSIDAQREARLQKDRDEAERIRREEQDLQRIRGEQEKGRNKKTEFYFGDAPKKAEAPTIEPTSAPAPAPAQAPVEEDNKSSVTSSGKKSIPSVFRQDSSSSATGGGDAPCQGCGKKVYMAERLSIDGKVYHKACFRCVHCNLQLKLSNYAPVDDRFYCKPHYKQLFQTHGNYNEGFGKEKLTRNWTSSQSDSPSTPAPAPTVAPTPSPAPAVAPAAAPTPAPVAVAATAPVKTTASRGSKAPAPAPAPAPKKPTPAPVVLSSSLFENNDDDDEDWFK
eukprot:TRINITY_DN1898_c0_g1_i1.p1 TRINITY_DN1898_c0_g1~~TRINITY_DN1898_c0_g1_i1.p1  ORF type:complete len:574 (-),score=176.52 TRINITY_DN1898_c0_g1_i1:77-1798(-)